MSSEVLATGNVLVPLDRIPTDEAAQTRVKPRPGVIRDYAAAMTAQIAEGGLRFLVDEQFPAAPRTQRVNIDRVNANLLRADHWRGSEQELPAVARAQQ